MCFIAEAETLISSFLEGAPVLNPELSIMREIWQPMFIGLIFRWNIPYSAASWYFFNQILNKIEQGILNGSMSASLEESSDFYSGDARCSVRVFERYSYSGGNRVSLSVTLFQNGNDAIHLSAITTGGSQAMFFKINTFGEEAFLDKLRELL